MTPAEVTTTLRQFNEWRRGDEDIPQFDPREIGEAIDAAVEMIDRLEAAESDALEQARMNGMGSEREAALMARLEAAEKERNDVAQQLVQSEQGKRKISEERDDLLARIEAMERQEPFDADSDVFRSAFEAALKAGNWPMTRQGDGYRSPSTQIAWRIAFSTVNRLKLYLAPGAQPAPIAQDTSVRKAWARFSNELHRSPDAPYPGMADAFERHFSQSFNDREWRSESCTWAAAWKAAKRHEVQAQPAPSMPECPYPCGWRNLLKLAIEDGAYLARSINEDEPVTENARAVTMRMVLRLRDVLMALNNAAPEDNP